MFYMNSVSDGTLSVYEKKSPTWEKLKEHSQSTSSSEPSALLQHLRLSLMAYNRKPGSASPEITVETISRNGVEKNKIIVKANFMVNNPSGHTTKLPTEIVFRIDEASHIVERTDFQQIYLEKIVVADHFIYGWWHSLHWFEK